MPIFFSKFCLYISYRDSRGRGAGRAKALPLFLPGLIFLGLQNKYDAVVCKCMINGGTVNPSASLSWPDFVALPL